MSRRAGSTAAGPTVRDTPIGKVCGWTPEAALSRAGPIRRQPRHIRGIRIEACQPNRHAPGRVVVAYGTTRRLLELGALRAFAGRSDRAVQALAAGYHRGGKARGRDTGSARHRA